jgi:hypothetical protein
VLFAESIFVFDGRSAVPMPKRERKFDAAGAAAKRPTLHGGGAAGAAANAKAMDTAVDCKAAPSAWLPTAAELKPALDALWRETSLIPDLNAIIADFADPCRQPGGFLCEYLCGKPRTGLLGLCLDASGSEFVPIGRADSGTSSTTISSLGKGHDVAPVRQ